MQLLPVSLVTTYVMEDKLYEIKRVWASNKVNPDLPLEWCQLLDKLVDESLKCAIPVKR